jgi:antitoxin VapB
MASSEPIHTRVFWSGGSQAVRVPRDMRLEGTEVLIQKRGSSLVIEPIDTDDWGDFWERLEPLARPLERGKTRAAERRRPL